MLKKEKEKEEKSPRKINFFEKEKLEENKRAEKEMWNKSKDLNKEFKDIKEHKKI